MKYLRKLPNYSHRAPPGLEWALLRRLPFVWLGGTLIPLFLVIASHLFPPDGSAIEVAKHLKLVQIFAIATVITVWTAVFTVAIGCVIVVLMKGPAYVADAYELPDSDKPKQD